MLLPQQMENIQLCFTLMGVDQNFVTTKGFTVQYYWPLLIIITSLSKSTQGVKVASAMEESTIIQLLKEAILNNSFNLPPPKPLAILEEADIIWDNDTAIPFMFVAEQ